MEYCVEITECIACGSNNLVPLLDLGMQPLANSFLKSENEPEDVFPLETNRCKNCCHVQLTHKVNPDLLFKNYLYVSGTAKTQLEYFDWFAKFVVENAKPVRVLDIGCNDGSQLDAFKRYGALTFGVDPAENLHKISSKNHHVECGYFDENYPTMDFGAVICQNAFAHNYDQLKFLRNMKRVVSDDGYIYITTSQADMIMNCEFDTIYHEHLSFYNIKSMNELCKRAGVNLVEVIRHPIHGTSYIFVISKTKARPAYIQLLIDEEADRGYYDEDTFEAYNSACLEVISEFALRVESIKKDSTIIGYGAPAKGNTLLNASGVMLDFIVDDNPLKQGMYTPGKHIPIFSSEKLKEYADKDVVFVPLAWNFFEEIRDKIKKMRPERNDLFLKYFPFVHMR
jgi:SAM-dependent methyltransferase